MYRIHFTMNTRILVFGIMGVVLMGLVAKIILMDIEYTALTQQYDWALEMAKMGLAEREDVMLKVKEQILI
jgi:hypothetical protein